MTRLNIGFVLVPDFTLLALAAFVDTLRLAADEGDRSRQVHCGWTVMSADGRAVRASNGVEVSAGPLGDPAQFDYVVVVGGTLHRGAYDAADAWLVRAAKIVPLVGICTGSFVLARAGLMAGRRACVSWFHKAEFEAEFPGLDVVADQLFVVDRDRITCAGGTGVVHLASHLVDRHLGPGWSAKGLRVMLEEGAREAGSPQPQPALPGLGPIADARVRRAMLLIERRLSAPPGAAELAHHVGTTPRQLSRLFRAATGRPPAAFGASLRLDRAHAAVIGTPQRLTRIALDHGFADAAHFARTYRAAYGCTPSAARREARNRMVSETI